MTAPVIATAAVTPQFSIAPSTQNCSRCHGMTTLAYRDPHTTDIVSLFIDPQRVSASVHGHLTCLDCHANDYQRYPHPATASNEQLACVACHKDGTKQRQHHRANEPQRQYQFTTIEQEYTRSIHATSDKPDVKGFNCHSCHDPHQFQRSQVGKPLAQIVRDDNQVCLDCHAKRFQSFATTHAWLPKRDKHWQAVRCLDCHTAITTTGQPVSHQILAAKQSQVACVNCHSRDAQLLNRLYQYRSQADVARTGLFAKAIFNDAYVVGMSRNPTVDTLGLVLIGVTLIGLTAHGIGRYRAAQQLRKG